MNRFHATSLSFYYVSMAVLTELTKPQVTGKVKFASNGERFESRGDFEFRLPGAGERDLQRPGNVNPPSRPHPALRLKGRLDS